MVDLGETKKVSQPSRSTVPFPAVVGQEALKEALLVVGANDELDGLLVRGEKGTAKSTATRAFTELLPDQRAIADCPYGCPPDDGTKQCKTCRTRDDPPVETRPVPFVTLPLGASRERVMGSLSVADALDGAAEFNPGLLARANRGFLYVDEVNLLDDHLVDVLLDAAASGTNRVERDGVSVTHPADFTLVGTMNPEEGELRPQFRDRFALQVEVTGAEDIDRRVAVVERSLSGFDGDYDAETATVRERLSEARERLPDVTIPESLTRELVELCLDSGVDGHRADIATARGARTLAALDGRTRVIEPDVRRAVELALPHRLRSRPFEDGPDFEDVIDDHFADGEGDAQDGEESSGDDEDQSGSESTGSADDRVSEGADSETEGSDDGDGSEGGDDSGEENHGDPESGGDSSGSRTEPRDSPRPSDADGASGDDSPTEHGGDDTPNDGDEEAKPLVPGQPPNDVAEPGDGVAPDINAPTAERADGSGRASARPSDRGRGTRVRTERAGLDDAVDPAASVRAAAVRGGDRVESRDLRQSVREGESSTLVVFAIDASASMRGPMRAAKGVALDLLRDAYECRDEVAVVTFAGESADVILPPTDSVDLAARHLKSLPTGERTPLPDGLHTAGELLARANPDDTVVVVVTDGRANAGSDSPTTDTRTAASGLADRGANVLVVDASDDGRTNLVEDIVSAADGERVPLEALTPNRVADAFQPTEGGDR
ncbi:VWA domain-containing protein [Halorussus limi]|uniref:VWA domain-containing protein n=1 Tax=Halorussus limi TaxID=2938695 RepID=A0A8U0HZ89_9EURY|nr:VWA domain-containing protein [Halorussus limi]UPV76248.1 VWA domain-containing protein [Halorussus limi]